MSNENNTRNVCSRIDEQSDAGNSSSGTHFISCDLFNNSVTLTFDLLTSLAFVTARTKTHEVTDATDHAIPRLGNHGHGIKSRRNDGRFVSEVIIPERTLVADGDRRKRKRGVEVEVEIDVLGARAKVDDLATDEPQQQSTGRQERQQPRQSAASVQQQLVVR